MVNTQRPVGYAYDKPQQYLYTFYSDGKATRQMVLRHKNADGVTVETFTVHELVGRLEWNENQFCEYQEAGE